MREKEKRWLRRKKKCKIHRGIGGGEGEREGRNDQRHKKRRRVRRRRGGGGRWELVRDEA